MKHPSNTAKVAHPAAEKKAPIRPAKKGNGPVASVAPSGLDQRDGQSDELIRQTAYFLYESRSCEGGHDLDDWLQAEAQIANPASPGASLPGL